jgi:peptidyl-prolyl cis-trans isomerase SurA
MRGREVKGKRLRLGIAIFLLCCGSLSSSEAVVDRIVAVVNKEIIMLSEVERWSRPFQEEIQTEDRLERKGRVQEVFRKVLDKIIEEKLIEQEAQRSGIKVTPKEIEGAIEDVRRRNRISQEELEKALAAEGLTLGTYKKEIEKKILHAKFISSVVKPEAKVGEEELRDFYGKNIDRYRVNESYRPAHIFFPVPKEATPEQIREIRKRSLRVLERIKEGEGFAKMAMEYSEDPSSRAEGGDLGYFKKGELLPILEKEAMELRVGEVSGTVRTELGFHILKLLDRKGGDPPPFEEVREKVQVDYYDTEMGKALQQFLIKLKEKSVIEIML